VIAADEEMRNRKKIKKRLKVGAGKLFPLIFIANTLGVEKVRIQLHP
jgi:hypothetical protein